MSTFIKQLTANGVYGRYDLSQSFKPGVNIFHGKNGTGKTTMLHIIANVLNQDYRRFAWLEFESISVLMSNGTKTRLKRSGSNADTSIAVSVNNSATEQFSVREVQMLETQFEQTGTPRPPRPERDAYAVAYFPAFRNMIEAWASVGSKSDQSAYMTRRAALERRLADTTAFARELFGRFVPDLSFPSPSDIESDLTEEIQRPVVLLGAEDRDLLAKAFVNVFDAIVNEHLSVPDKTPESILHEIEELAKETGPKYEHQKVDAFAVLSIAYPETYQKLHKLIGSFQSTDMPPLAVPILEIYRQLLVDRQATQRSLLQNVGKYLTAVNQLLGDKQLIVTLESNRQVPRRNRSSVSIQFTDESVISGLKALSSGERQIVTLIYAATHMSKQSTVLIDEPEISLHVDWQRKLLDKMSEQLGERQIIACTHSPVIGGDHEMSAFELTTASRMRQKDGNEDEPESEFVDL